MNWRSFHIIVLIGAILAIMASYGFTLSDVGWRFLGIRWPLHCLFQHPGGFCMFCGAIRSFAAAAHGDFQWAAKFSFPGVMLFWFAIFQIPYRIMAIMKHPDKINWFIRKFNGFLFLLVVLSFFLQWALFNVRHLLA